MVRERVMVLNMISWVRVRGWGVSSWVCWGVEGAGEGCGGAGGCCCRSAENLRMSSLVTRPSLPVPGTWEISTPSSLERCRVAGVARAACLPVWTTGDARMASG